MKINLLNRLDTVIKGPESLETEEMSPLATKQIEITERESQNPKHSERYLMMEQVQSDIIILSMQKPYVIRRMIDLEAKELHSSYI